MTKTRDLWKTHAALDRAYRALDRATRLAEKAGGIDSKMHTLAARASIQTSGALEDVERELVALGEIAKSEEVSP